MTKYNPDAARRLEKINKPIKGVWAFSIIVGVILIVGLIGSFVAGDVHVFYWSLVAVPGFTIIFPLMMGLFNELYWQLTYGRRQKLKK